MRQKRSASQKDIKKRINKLLEHFDVKLKTLALMLRVSESTVKRWQKGIGVSRINRLFKFHKLEDLVKLAETIFAKRKAIGWYHRPAVGLGMITPIDFMLKNTDGVEKVINLVGCIKWGIYS